MTGPADPKRLAWRLRHRAAALELYARQFCPCAEDVVQEAVVELAALRERPRDDVGWLYAVVRHKALTAARGEGRRKRREERAAEDWLEAYDEELGP